MLDDMSSSTYQVRCIICGIFGYIADGDGKADLERLRRIARETMRRGPHAFGFAWVDGKGHLRMYKQAGRIVDALGLLAMARDARMLIGHCRWATHGTPDNNLNNHPHPVDGGWLVHNGVIPDYEGIVRDFRFRPVTRCDSELFGLLVERREGTLLRRMIDASGLAGEKPLTLAGIWNRPGRLVLVRRGNPLCLGTAAEGSYFASLPGGLPDGAEEMPDESAIEFTKGKMRAVAV
jgi:glucosamine 6-phosphate synthetase-like amidotransferase/phosphosugar isomerase protein